VLHIPDLSLIGRRIALAVMAGLVVAALPGATIRLTPVAEARPHQASDSLAVDGGSVGGSDLSGHLSGDASGGAPQLDDDRAPDDEWFRLPEVNFGLGRRAMGLKADIGRHAHRPSVDKAARSRGNGSIGLPTESSTSVLQLKIAGLEAAEARGLAAADKSAGSKARRMLAESDLQAILARMKDLSFATNAER